MDVIKKPLIAAVSGVKNSGKTTFLEKLVGELKSRGYRVAVIKHDGHEFEPDVPGTDTWKIRRAGAYGTAIYSHGQWMVCKQENDMDEKRLGEFFPEADFILLEGFKYSVYPKFEIVRKGNSCESVCDAKTLLGLVTDTELRIEGVRTLGLEDWKIAADILEVSMNHKKTTPSMDAWMKEAKLHESAPKIGMYLTHNGIVRKSAKAKVRYAEENAKDVVGMVFSYDSAKVDEAIRETYQMDGIYYIKVWLNEGELQVGDDIMYVLIGGDIRPHVVEALQFLVGKLKNECVQEQEIYE